METALMFTKRIPNFCSAEKEIVNFVGVKNLSCSLRFLKIVSKNGIHKSTFIGQQKVPNIA